ncbi:hypothetical protein R3Q06_00365 [Rhodococcus erythropolis]|uniref:hypothetical protein n=1 Tax=Rhodococcus erythropolis TaxID=1833 RepID=UPI00294911CC|nr:hypothetical protein [Rhodococcus erythropolis]MDV6271941.1 hypothetical protein [Rhodococcus erythropolis]
MSDSEVQVAFRKVLHDLPMTIIDWQPRDADGRSVHGQVEAYVDYWSTNPAGRATGNCEASRN